jgi:hypothetical protein
MAAGPAALRAHLSPNHKPFKRRASQSYTVAIEFAPDLNVRLEQANTASKIDRSERVSRRSDKGLRFRDSASVYFSKSEVSKPLVGDWSGVEQAHGNRSDAMQVWW